MFSFCLFFFFFLSTHSRRAQATSQNWEKSIPVQIIKWTESKSKKFKERRQRRDCTHLLETNLNHHLRLRRNPGDGNSGLGTTFPHLTIEFQRKWTPLSNVLIQILTFGFNSDQVSRDAILDLKVHLLGRIRGNSWKPSRDNLHKKRENIKDFSFWTETKEKKNKDLQRNTFVCTV